MSKPITAKIAMIITIVSCFSAVGIRTYQLINITDPSTGFLTVLNNTTVYAFYGVMLICFASIFSLNFSLKCRAEIFQSTSNRAISGFSYFLSAMFFLDFIHQVQNSFYLIEDSQNIQLNEILPIALIGISALLTCFYFITFGISYSTKSYDFKNFGYLHIVPVIWSICRLLVILLQAINFRYDLGSIVKCSYLIMVVIFFCYFALGIADEKSINTNRFVTVGLTLFVLGIVLSLPRFLLVIFTKSNLLTKESSSPITDFALSVFVFVFSYSIIKRSKKEM